MKQARVLIVDDSVVVRRIVSEGLSADPGIEVVGIAANGQLALDKLDKLDVDVVVLDIEMPVMDGLTTLREIRKRNRRLPVIMFSTLTERGAAATLEALSAGASDYVTKPANVGSVTESRERVRAELAPKIKALAEGAAARGFASARPAAPLSTAHLLNRSRPSLLPESANGLARTAQGGATGRPGTGARGQADRLGQPSTRPLARPRTAGTGPLILAIGCSTGGPEALSSILRELPADLPVPVVVVQHMPPVFTALFAERLDKGAKLTVHEARDGMPLSPGHVYLAPGDFHLEVERSGGGAAGRVQTKLHQRAQENFCRPAVDVLFRSVARAYGAQVLALVLTGMGSDGKLGAGDIAAAGGEILVQDRASSVVWGMPGAVAEAGLAHSILPLTEIAGQLVQRMPRRPPSLPTEFSNRARAPQHHLPLHGSEETPQ
ncbi:chemotaxis response regulator protein-glutamate methylesterase [Jatrophihabitans telluris]|uniref:Protein-glutamate methylesterase/protein-glutamine glutaminase n=1 Tax=Jatrophihabitans telluris TaxID=2038343 RepID=A0ABY4R3K3_9ACTN|nr:chemotaxis response regulator protein-glutamate methylesterase [Jatrophihabitans telluris]UQX89589.1 chemotaxis response regulator protein-glutamate methylesterase [Jatrophihabitans telluris]